ncbi:MAG: hypothetical protein KIT68_07520 [Phycisphaeraceae bacterium]|nr:hypothetical protein [Phycisphaeraceae bacterium]
MTTRTLTAIVAGLAGSAAAAHGQTIAFTGAPYTQDFNGLPMTGTSTLTGRGPHALQGVLGATGLSGWYGANFTGSSANTEVKAHDGSLASSAGRGLVSFGTNDSAERALGALPTSNQISTFGAVFTNASGSVINEIRVSFTGEQWRRGNVLFANTLQFSYGTPASSIELLPVQFPDLDFVGPNLQDFPLETALDGNLNTNKQVIEATLTNLAWQPGADLALSWTINDLTGQDNGLAIDDFSMSLPGGGGPTAAARPTWPPRAARSRSLTGRTASSPAPTSTSSCRRSSRKSAAPLPAAPTSPT